MGKLLLWVVVIGLVIGAYRFVQLLERKSARAREQRPDPDAARELVLSCAHCGVHVPASEAVMARGNAYCSVEHREAE